MLYDIDINKTNIAYCAGSLRLRNTGGGHLQPPFLRSVRANDGKTDYVSYQIGRKNTLLSPSSTWSLA